MHGIHRCRWDVASQDAVQLSLVLEVLHHVLHVPQLAAQLALLIAEPIQLLANVADVGLEHAVNVDLCGGVLLQEAPLGFQLLVLHLQGADLKWGKSFRVQIPSRSEESTALTA